MRRSVDEQIREFLENESDSTKWVHPSKNNEEDEDDAGELQ